jgi:hypothetical protein
MNIFLLHERHDDRKKQRCRTEAVVDRKERITRGDRKCTAGCGKH